MSKAAMIVVVSFQWVLILGATPVVWAADPMPSSAPTPTKPAGEQLDPRTLPKETQTELRKDCEADAKRLCHHVIPGGGRILRCLEAHSSDLSPDCRQALSEAGLKP